MIAVTGKEHTLAKLKVFDILSYYSSDYIRTRTILAALQQLDIELLLAVNTWTNFFRYLQTIAKLIKIRFQHNPDYYILGFRGHDIFWFVRLVTAGKCLIFDSLMSPYDALKNEKKAGKAGMLFSWFLYPIEKLILKYSNIILTDTNRHCEFFIDTFHVKPEKIKPVYVGASEEFNLIHHDREELQVLFYGSFLPLHGKNVILQAAHNLRDKPIHFTLIGGNITEPLEQNITYIKWVEFDELCDRYIADADLFLGGPFGGTKQARRVITGKTFQGLAMAKTTVIGRIDEPVGFKDKINCLLIEQNNPDQLTSAILWAYLNRDKLSEIGLNGQKLYHDKFSIKKIADQLSEIIT